MVEEIHVEGFDAYKKAAEEHKAKTVFALFSGSKDSNGSSWCPDCVVAEPVIAKMLSFAPKDAVLIHCGVGKGAFWKDKDNVFRKDASLRLKSVPTLLKVDSARRLEEGQCAEEGLVQMFFEDE
ncbi:hypothetical protein ACOMHN_056686 [Nucella lapillus]